MDGSKLNGSPVKPLPRRKLQPLPGPDSKTSEREAASSWAGTAARYSAGPAATSIEQRETLLPGSVNPEEQSTLRRASPQSLPPLREDSVLESKALPARTVSRAAIMIQARARGNAVRKRFYETSKDVVATVALAGLARRKSTRSIKQHLSSREERAQKWGWTERDAELFWSTHEPGAQPAAAKLAEVEQLGYLTYGDLVILQCSQCERTSAVVGGALHGNGFVDHSLRLQTSFSPIREHRECLWEVLPQLMYDAAKLLFKLTVSESESHKSRHARHKQATEVEAKKRELLAKVKEEEQYNAEVIQRLYSKEGGTRVQFTDTIQLRHVQSGKFLCLVPRTAADLDPESMRLELREGSEAAIFRLQPRYRIFLDSANVAYGAQVMLQSMKLGTHSLHVSGVPEANEVNLSTNIQGWRFIRYSQSAVAHGFLPAGTSVHLFHPEADALLSASTSRYKKNPALVRYKGNTQPVKSMWVVEKYSGSQGGEIHFGEHVRFKHLTSGRYLAVESSLSDESTREIVLWCPREMKVDDFDDVTLFALYPMSNEDGAVNSAGVGLATATSTRMLHVQHVSSGCWLHNTKVINVHEQESPAKTNVVKQKGFSEGSFKCAVSKERHDQDAIVLQLASAEVFRKVEWAKQCASSVDIFISQLRAKVAEVGGPDRLTLHASDVQVVERCLREAIFMSFHEPDTSQDPAQITIDETSGHVPIAALQILFRETKLLDSFIWGLGAAEALDITTEQMLAPALMPLLHITQMLYKLVTISFFGCRRNELYAATRCAGPLNIAPYLCQKEPVTHMVNNMIEHTIGEVGDEVGAEDCLRSLVSNNLVLLESCVDQETLERFVSLIGQKGPNRIFMDFMTALCSCEGKQVITNQEDMLRIFLAPQLSDGTFALNQFKQNRRELIIETFLDYDAARAPFVSLSDEKWKQAHPGETLDHGQFLGKDLTKGLPPLMIAWYSSDSWTKGMPQLFFSPASLGINSRRVKSSHSFAEYILALTGSKPEHVEAVSLSSIAWVMEPDRLAERPRCANKPWHKIQEAWLQHPEAKQQHDRCLQLVQYFKSQLKLFAEMCLDRSYNCIASLERMFSFDMLMVGIMDENLPNGLRSTFALLFQRLYIDRFPHVELKLPTLVRLWSEVPDHADLQSASILPQFRLSEQHPLRQHENPLFNLPDSNKMHLVEDFISDLFMNMGGAQVLEDKAMNTFILRTLGMVKLLVHFGFYATLHEIADLLGPLISTLDPRADVQTYDEVHAKKKIELAEPRGSSMSGAMLVPAHVDAHINTVIRFAQVQMHTLNHESSSRNSRLRTDSQSVEKQLDDRWKNVATPQSNLILLSKECMIDVLLYFGQVRLDYQLTRCIMAYKKLLSEAGEDSILTEGDVQTRVEGLFQSLGGRAKRTGVATEHLAPPMLKRFLDIFEGPEARDFDFDVMSDAPLMTICLDLMMYNKPEIFQLALELLTQTFSQHDSLVTAMESIQLLFSAKSSEAFFVLQSKLAGLKNDLESYETWGIDNDFSPADDNVHQRVLDVLLQLTNFCTLGDEEDTGVPNIENQTLFRNMSVYKIVLRAIEIEEPGRETESDHLIAIKRLALRFLSRFMLLNKKNQHTIFSVGFDTIIATLNSAQFMADALNVVEATFEQNAALASTVSPGLLEKVAVMIDNAHKQGHPSPQMLNFFEKLAVVDSTPIQRNQLLILQVLTQPKFEDRVMIGVDQSDDLAGRVAKHKEFLRSSPFRNYHLTLIHLLAQCAAGKNAQVEIRLLKFFSPDHILTIAMEPEADLQQRHIFSALLYHVCMDADMHAKSLEATLRGSDTLNFYQLELEKLSLMQTLTQQQREYLLEAVFPVLSGTVKILGGIEGAEVRQSAGQQAVVLAQNLDGHLNEAEIHAFHDHVHSLCPSIVGEIDSIFSQEAPEAHDAPLEGQARDTSMFKRFVKAIRKTPEVQAAIAHEHEELVDVLMNVENLTDPDDPAYKRNLAARDNTEEHRRAKADIRKKKIEYSDLLKRIVSYMELNSEDMSPPSFVSGLRILTAIVTRAIVAYDKLNEEAGQKAVTRARQEMIAVQDTIAQSGAAALCVKLLSSKRDAIVCSAMELAICMLEGGNVRVQQLMYQELLHSSLAIEAIHARLQRAKTMHKLQSKQLRTRAKQRRSASMIRSQSTISPDDDILIKKSGLDYLHDNPVQAARVYRMLQLFCEGHNSSMQNILRQQQTAKNNIDIISMSMSHLTQLCKNEERLTMYTTKEDLKTIEALLDFVIDAMQGPCHENQRRIVEAGLLTTYSTILIADFSTGVTRPTLGGDGASVASEQSKQSGYPSSFGTGLSADLSGVMNLDSAKMICAKALKAVTSALEGRKDSDLLDEVCTKINVGNLKSRLMEIYVDYTYLKDVKGKEDANWDEKHNEEGFDLLSLMEQMSNHRPQLKEIIRPTDKSEKDLFDHYMLGLENTKHEHDRAWEKVNTAVTYRQAYRYFASNVATVECMLDARLDRLWFPVPSECVNLLSETKEKLLSEVSLGSQEEKLKDFLERGQEIVFEMQHIELLAQSIVYRVLKDYYPEIKLANFATAILINLALFLSFKADSSSGKAEVDEGMRLPIFVLGIINIALSTAMMSFAIASRAPPIKNHLRRIRRSSLAAGHGFHDAEPVIMLTLMLLAMTGIVALDTTYRPLVPSLLIGTACLTIFFSLRALRAIWTTPVSNFSINYCWLYDSLCESRIRWQILYQCASVVGIVHPVGYPFLLFDVCMMSPTLQSVLKSILLPARQLGMTAVLICFIVYMFSFVSVTGFRRSFLNSLSFALLDPSIPPEEQEMTMAEFDCQSLIDCFVKQLHYGLIVGTVTTTLQAGGYDYNVMPGDDWFNRVILDLTFWLVITIFMMNIVLGVIVDTFSALRAEQNERENILKHHCFICGTHRSKFDQLVSKTGNHAVNFETHIEKEHNVWNYIKFIAYLHHKDPTEYTGSESRIAALIVDGDTSWVPGFTSITLQASDL